MKEQRYENKVSIENCIRSFIIKSIHAIVQARNGIIYNTNCISAVGARNNLMVNIEEDPEIGATIKQTLDAGFPVRVRDVLSLEILTAWPNNERVVVEVWQFRLDTTDRLGTTVTADHSSHSSPSSEKDPPPGPEGDGTQTGEIAVEDFRQSRLFEKLGTLLKAVIVATRLLPAYTLSRKQDPVKYQMCYTLRRGATNLSRLGTQATSQQIGRLFSGLAVKLPNLPQEQCAGSEPPENLDRVFLNCTVHYRLEPSIEPSSGPKSNVPGSTKLNSSPDNPHTNRGRHRTSRFPVPVEAKFSDYQFPELDHQNKASPRVRPAFAEDAPDEQLDDHDYPHHMFLGPHHNYPHGAGFFSDIWSGEEDGDEDQYDENGYDENSDPDHTDLSETIHPKNGSDDLPADGTVEHAVHHTTPLQLPFSTVGVSGDRLTHFFTELREQANLDLFKVPASNMGTVGTRTTSQTQSSLFDAEALSDELERHEKILKEFDDFMGDFCRMDPFGPEVRSLAPNSLMPGRPTHFTTEPP